MKILENVFNNYSKVKYDNNGTLIPKRVFMENVFDLYYTDDEFTIDTKNTMVSSSGQHYTEFNISKYGISFDIYTNFWFEPSDKIIVSFFDANDKEMKLEKDTILVLMSVVFPNRHIKMKITYLEEPCDVIINYDGFFCSDKIRREIYQNALYLENMKYKGGELLFD